MHVLSIRNLLDSGPPFFISACSFQDRRELIVQTLSSAHTKSSVAFVGLSQGLEWRNEKTRHSKAKREVASNTAESPVIMDHPSHV